MIDTVTYITVSSEYDVSEELYDAVVEHYLKNKND